MLRPPLPAGHCYGARAEMSADSALMIMIFMGLKNALFWARTGLVNGHKNESKSAEGAYNTSVPGGLECAYRGI